MIQDVVYNHYDSKAERAEWQYDSTAPEENIYYWYEGDPSTTGPDGGYVDNGSQRFHAAVLGGGCPAAVHQQRGRSWSRKCTSTGCAST